jgi:hypothetical protein
MAVTAPCRRLDRATPVGRTHLALQDTEALGIVVCFVIREIELLGGFSWCGNDVLVLGQFRLPADAGIGGVFGVGRWRRDDGVLPIIFGRRDWLVGVAGYPRSDRERRRRKNTRL